MDPLEPIRKLAAQPNDGLGLGAVEGVERARPKPLEGAASLVHHAT
jgi:hypothetical protein